MKRNYISNSLRTLEKTHTVQFYLNGDNIGNLCVRAHLTTTSGWIRTCDLSNV